MSYGNTIRNINTLRQINNARRAITYHADVELPEAKKNLNGMTWRIILSVCIMKDCLDPIKDFCLSGLQVIPVIGQALGGIVTVLVFFVGMLIVGTIMLYWRFNGVSVFVPNLNRSATRYILKSLGLLTLFLDFLPYISTIPWTSIYFYLNVRMENRDREKGRQLREEYRLGMNRGIKREFG